MLRPANLFELTSNITDVDNFMNEVNEIIKNGPFFEIEDFYQAIEEYGYESLINIINNIIRVLLEVHETVLLDKMIWLKRVLLKHHRESLLDGLINNFLENYSPFDSNIDRDFSNLNYLTEELIKANHTFARWLEGDEASFEAHYRDYCYGLSYEELVDFKKQTKPDNMIKTILELKEISELSEYQTDMITKSIKAYFNLKREYINKELKDKEYEYKKQVKRKKALLQLYPENIEGQEVLEFTKPYIEQSIDTIIESTKSKTKSRVLKTDDNNYQQLNLF